MWRLSNTPHVLASEFAGSTPLILAAPVWALATITLVGGIQSLERDETQRIPHGTDVERVFRACKAREGCGVMKFMGKFRSGFDLKEGVTTRSLHLWKPKM